MDPRADNARTLAGKVLDEVDNAILDLVEAGSGQLLVEVRRASHNRRRVLVTQGTTSCVTLPAEELGAETQTRLERRRHQEDSKMPDGPAREASPRAPRRYLATEQVARRYGISEAAVRQRRHRGQLPPAVKVGRSLRWDESDLDRWDDAHKAGAPRPEHTAQ